MAGQNVVDDDGIGIQDVADWSVILQHIFEVLDGLFGQGVANLRGEFRKVFFVSSMIGHEISYAQPTSSEFLSHSANPIVLHHATDLPFQDCRVVEMGGLSS